MTATMEDVEKRGQPATATITDMPTTPGREKRQNLLSLRSVRVLILVLFNVFLVLQAYVALAKPLGLHLHGLDAAASSSSSSPPSANATPLPVAASSSSFSGGLPVYKPIVLTTSNNNDGDDDLLLATSTKTDENPEQQAVLHLAPRAPQTTVTPGAACSGSEGQWNCMTTSWQRCAAGRWSVVMQMSAGSTCAPVGLTNDFKIQHSGTNGGQTSTSGATSVSSSSNALGGLIRGGEDGRWWVGAFRGTLVAAVGVFVACVGFAGWMA